MAIPLINWSSTVRREGVRPLFVYWHILMLLALLALFMILQKKSYRPAISVAIDQTWCTLPFPSNTILYSVAKASAFLAKYDCRNPCQTTRLNTPFCRNPDTPRLQPLPTPTEKLNPISGVLAHTSIPLITLQSIYGSLLHVFGKKSPREVRNASFNYLGTTRLHRSTIIYGLSLGLHASIHLLMILTAAFSIP